MDNYNLHITLTLKSSLLLTPTPYPQTPSHKDKHTELKLLNQGHFWALQSFLFRLWWGCQWATNQQRVALEAQEKLEDENTEVDLAMIYGGICRAAMETETQRTDLWPRAGGRPKRMRWMDRGAWRHTHYHMWNREPVGICSMTQGAQTGALWQPRGVRWGGKSWTRLSNWTELNWRTSLLVQWYPPCKAGDLGSVPGQLTKIPQASQQLSLDPN